MVDQLLELLGILNIPEGYEYLYPLAQYMFGLVLLVEVIHLIRGLLIAVTKI